VSIFTADEPAKEGVMRLSTDYGALSGELGKKLVISYYDKTRFYAFKRNVFKYRYISDSL